MSRVVGLRAARSKSSGWVGIVEIRLCFAPSSYPLVVSLSNYELVLRQGSGRAEAKIRWSEASAERPGDLSPPVIKEIRQGLPQRNLRRPAELFANPRRVALDERQIVRPEPFRVDADAHLDARQCDDLFDHVANRDRAPRADVVGPAGPPALEDDAIGAHGVAHVGDLAPGVQVADDDLRIADAGFDFGDLPRESRRRVRRFLARSDVVERAGDADPQTVAAGADGEELLRELAEAIRTRRH